VNDRFVTNLDEVKFLDKDGNIIQGDQRKYLEEMAIAEDTYQEKLNVNDIVKIKNSDYHVQVTQLDYEIPGIGTFDYAGKKIEDPDSDRLSLFNQRDIEYKVNQKSK